MPACWCVCEGGVNLLHVCPFKGADVKRNVHLSIEMFKPDSDD